MLPDFERAGRIGEFWSYPQSRASAELLIDCEEDRTLRAVLVGMLAEMERNSASVWLAAVKGRHDREGGAHHAALTLGSSCEYRISAIRLAMMTADEKSRNSACIRKKSFERIANTVSCPSPG